MEGFIARENIRRFRAQLRSFSDEAQKKVLRELLKVEQAKLADDARRHDTPSKS